jgi:hypothetical protein
MCDLSSQARNGPGLLRLLVDERQRLGYGEIAQRAEPVSCAHRLALEPRSDHVHQQTVDEPRDDQFCAAASSDGLVTEQLEQQLQLSVPLCFVRWQMDERWK